MAAAPQPGLHGPPVPPVQTVRQAMAICGVDDATQWQNMTQAQRMAADVFNDNFASCMDKSMEELNDDFKSFAELRANQGQIKLGPGPKKKIKAFIQLCRDEIRMGRNPANHVFPIGNQQLLEYRMKTHSDWVKHSDEMAKRAEPQPFTNDVKWEDFEPTFHKYLGKLVGRNGVPLSYVTREHDAPDPTPHNDFMVMYVRMAPLNGPAYLVDNEMVLTILMKYVMGNTLAEGAIRAINTDDDGRAAFLAVKVKFLGQGIMMSSVTQAEFTIEKLFYNGEKYPGMYWTKFETELNRAYAVVDKQSGRSVHDDAAKLRKLQLRIKCPNMSVTKDTVDARMMDEPMTMTLDTAMRIYRNKVQALYPHGPNHRSNVNRRGIAQVGRGQGNHQHQGGGRGSGGRGNRQNNRQNRRNNETNRPRNHPDQETIVLANGQHIKYHPSYHFTQHEMTNMTNVQRDRLRQARADYHAQQGRQPRRTNQDRDAQIAEMQSTIASLRAQQQQQVPPQVQTQTGQSQISQVSMGSSGSAFGGRRGQDRQRQRDGEAPR